MWFRGGLMGGGSGDLQNDVDPKEGSWEVGVVICKSAFANYPSHLS
jgi:hypothetical protein